MFEPHSGVLNQTLHLAKILVPLSLIFQLFALPETLWFNQTHLVRPLAAGSIAFKFSKS